MARSSLSRPSSTRPRQCCASESCGFRLALVSHAHLPGRARTIVSKWRSSPTGSAPGRRTQRHTRIMVDGFCQELDGRVHVLLLVVVLHGARVPGCRGRTPCRLAYRIPAGAPAARAGPVSSIVSTSRVTTSCKANGSPAASVLERALSSRRSAVESGNRKPHLAARELDHTRQHERGTEFGTRLFDGIDRRLAYLALGIT